MTWQELIFCCIPIIGLLVICIIALLHKNIYNESKSNSNAIKSKPYIWFEYKKPKEK